MAGCLAAGYWPVGAGVLLPFEVYGAAVTFGLDVVFAAFGFCFTDCWATAGRLGGMSREDLTTAKTKTPKSMIIIRTEISLKLLRGLIGYLTSSKLKSISLRN